MTDAARTAEWGEDAVEAVARAITAAGLCPGWTGAAAHAALAALTPLAQAREAAAEMRGREDARAAVEAADIGLIVTAADRAAYDALTTAEGAIAALPPLAGASALDAAVQRAVAAAYEEAAKVAEEQEAHIPHLKARDYPDDMGRLIQDIAAAIRARAAEGGGQ